MTSQKSQIRISAEKLANGDVKCIVSQIGLQGDSAGNTVLQEPIAGNVKDPKVLCQFFVRIANEFTAYGYNVAHVYKTDLQKMSVPNDFTFAAPTLPPMW